MKGFVGICTLLIFILCYSCISFPNQHASLPPGIWRGLIYINEYQNIIITEGRNEVISRDVQYEDKSTFIPFNFEIQIDSLQQLSMVVYNADEKIIFSPIDFGRDPKTGDDTFRIQLAPYDACIKGVFQEDKLRGHYIVLDKPNYYMPFEAHFGQAHRFRKLPEPVSTNVNGSYQVVFTDTSGTRFDAIGEFKQNGTVVNGTFRTETGDFRFLQGEIAGNRLSLSSFDGAHAFLFTAEVSGDVLEGKFYSGKHYSATWKGTKTKEVRLRPSDSISYSSKPDQLFKFRFQTPDSTWIDFEDYAYKGKIKVVQVLGSWCPNCRDESEFLNQYLVEHNHKDLKIVGLAFERKMSLDRVKERIGNYKKSLKIDYPIAYGGIANKDTAAAVLGQLNGIFAFPTTLFIDRNNRIYKVHTGFDGPATSQYEAYKNDFHKTVTLLLQQK